MQSFVFEISVPEVNEEIKKLKSAVVKQINDLRPIVYRNNAKFFDEEQTRTHLKREIKAKFSFKKLNKKTIQLVMLKKDKQ